MKTSLSLVQCCMCGDSGITAELFRCKICNFRSQHRYCSNLYPNSASYKVCNWCLNQKEKSQNSLNSSASCKGKIEEDNDEESKKHEDNNHRAVKQRNRNDLKQQQRVIKNPMKKPNLEEKLWRRANACLQEKPRARKSEERSKNGHGFRNKVRRYKLLEDVST